MIFPSKVQLTVIIGAFLLFVVLLFSNTTPPPKKQVVESILASSIDREKIINESKTQLNAENKKVLAGLEKNIQSGNKTYSDSVLKFWDKLNKPVVAAFYAEEKAQKNSAFETWFDAGNRYYAGTKFTAEQERPALFQKAIDCYMKAVEAAPKNLDAKTALGVCYVEGTSDPMKGITLLREVVAADSNNINANVNLGLFAIKSGQTEKAIQRFKKILTIAPNYIEAYLYLADCYEKSGDKANAIKNLENYQNLVTDTAIKSEVQNYINNLKNI